MRLTVALLLLLLAGQAEAQSSVSLKVSLTGLYYTEQEQAPPPGVLASPVQLAFFDARTVLDARNLADRVDLRFDARVRATGDYGFEGKFINQESAFFSKTTTPISARGYLGGPEFELREAYLGVRLSRRLSLQLGRMFVTEADSIKVDAVRLNLRLGARWQGGLFAGGYPNPYSRSVLTDYTPPCGDGVASGNQLLQLQVVQANQPTAVAAATALCQTGDPQLALAAGLTARYTYPSLQGSIGLVGSFFGGPGDGGAVVRDPTVLDRVGNLQPPIFDPDSPRVFVSWQHNWTPVQRLSFFLDLVADLFGSAGPQLTRLLASSSLRLGRADQVSLRLAYSHMSSLAINMYLGHLLYNRFPNGTTVGGLGVVENNLTVLRTARDELRSNLDVKLVKKWLLFLEGRFRYRQLIGGDNNPEVYASVDDATGYNANVRNLAGDGSIGLRDSGSWKGLRSLVAYTFLQNFRASSHLLRVGAGKSWLDERLSIDLEYVFLATTDEGAGGSACNVNQNQPHGDGVAQLSTTISLFLPDCFGRRNGTSHEAGFTLTANPWRRMFLLLDYRFSALLTEQQGVQLIPTVFGHALLARVEAGF